MTTAKTTQTFVLSKEDVQTAVSEFVEKRYGRGGAVKVDVGVKTVTVGYGTAERDSHVAEVTAVREAGAPAAPTGLEGGYDPIRDEKREFTLDEFLHVSIVELKGYADTFRDQNEFTRGKHTWNVWFRQFHEFMSW